MKAEDLKNQLSQTIDQNCLALGNDLVYLPDFIHSLTVEFMARVYSPAELAYCRSFSEPTLRYASTWAAKEAVYKALKQIYMNKSGSMPGWAEIQILRHKPAGKPCVHLPERFNPYKISLSISHDGDYAWAIASLSMADPTRINP